MKITDIAPRRHRLSQLYIDGEAAVKVDTETLLRRGIAIGDELDDEELHELLQASAKHRAEEKALYLLEHRAHSKKELENKITRAEFDREAARSAVEHMEDLGLLNDEDYARRLANELFTRKRFGARRVKQELRQKGIDDALIAAVDVVDEPLAVLDRQQPLLGGVVADADDHAVEQVQRFVDQSRMAAREGVERPGEDCSAFHIGQR